MWERSVATPGVFTTSYRESSLIKGQALHRRERGCREVSEYVQMGDVHAESELTWPIPPEAPATTKYIISTAFSFVNLPASYQL